MGNNGYDMQGEHAMDQKKIDRINVLARKSRAEGLTDAEKKEQLALRQAYVTAFRQSLTNQLDNTWIVDEQGNKRRLERRPDTRKKGAAPAEEPEPLKLKAGQDGEKTAD